MKLRELINRLELLSHEGAFDDLEVVLKKGNEWEYYPRITSAWLNRDPDYNFDESNQGPEEWIELETED